MFWILDMIIEECKVKGIVWNLLLKVVEVVYIFVYDKGNMINDKV